MDLSQRLAGRVAVITGGGSGIGLAAGRRMRAEGATIVVGDVDVEAGVRPLTNYQACLCQPTFAMRTPSTGCSTEQPKPTAA